MRSRTARYATCRVDFARAARPSATRGRATLMITADRTTTGKVVLVSGFGRKVGRAAAGERERVDHPVVQFLGYALVQRGLLEGQVVADGVVGDLRGLVVADDRGQGGDH